MPEFELSTLKKAINMMQYYIYVQYNMHVYYIKKI